MENMKELSLDETEKVVGGLAGSGEMPIGEVKRLIGVAKSMGMNKSETISWLVRDYGSVYNPTAIAKQVNIFWDIVPG